MSRGRAINNRSRNESCAYCTCSGLKQHLHLNFVGQPPFRYAFARATEDDAVTAWWFILWNHIVIFASSCSPEHLDYACNHEEDQHA